MTTMTFAGQHTAEELEGLELAEDFLPQQGITTARILDGDRNMHWGDLELDGNPFSCGEVKRLKVHPGYSDLLVEVAMVSTNPERVGGLAEVCRILDVPESALADYWPASRITVPAVIDMTTQLAVSCFWMEHAEIAVFAQENGGSPWLLWLDAQELRNQVRDSLLSRTWVRGPGVSHPGTLVAFVPNPTDFWTRRDGIWVKA